MNEAYFNRLIHRINSAYGCFLLWKCIRVSISIPESGQQEAERRTSIMNRYGGTFSAILYALENTFITDLHKLFDKSKSNLKLETLIKNIHQKEQKEIKILIKSIEEENKRIKTLRDNVTAHDPKNPQEEKIFTQEIEKIFSTTQKLLNIISKSISGTSFDWSQWEEHTKDSFSCIISDLERGYNK